MLLPSNRHSSTASGVRWACTACCAPTNRQRTNSALSASSISTVSHPAAPAGPGFPEANSIGASSVPRASHAPFDYDAGVPRPVAVLVTEREQHAGPGPDHQPLARADDHAPLDRHLALPDDLAHRRTAAVRAPDTRQHRCSHRNGTQRQTCLQPGRLLKRAPVQSARRAHAETCERTSQAGARSATQLVGRFQRSALTSAPGRRARCRGPGRGRSASPACRPAWPRQSCCAAPRTAPARPATSMPSTAAPASVSPSPAITSWRNGQPPIRTAPSPTRNIPAAAQPQSRCEPG